MKTKTEVEKDILNITMEIHNKFPELSKFIEEMPIQYAKNDQPEMAAASLKKYYNSLNELVMEYKRTHSPDLLKDTSGGENLTEKLSYPASEDMYNKSKLATEVHPGDPSRHKSENSANRKAEEVGLRGNRPGDDMDVPGSELDDQQESVGSEDEENNYYSLGGDAHNDLEEDKA